jgi:FkbM family methyltransferase
MSNVAEQVPLSTGWTFASPFALFSRCPPARRNIWAVSARIAFLTANRLLNRPFPFTLYKNVKLYARFDFGSPILAYCFGLYEEASMHFLIRYLKAEDRFADVGANVGVYTVLAAGATGARVHAFEPFNNAYAALKQNVALNALEGRAILHRQGVGACAGAAFITTAQKGSSRIVDASTDEPLERIKIVALDEALSADVPAVIKIDVDGYEEQVLLGAQRVLSSNVTNVVMMQAGSGSAGDNNRVARCLRMLEQHGFRACTFDPRTGALLQCARGAPEYVGPNDESFLLVKDIDKARRRIRA